MSGWTASDLARLGLRRAGAKSIVRENRTTEIAGTLKESLKVRKARICAKASSNAFHKSGEMNKLEAEYAARLEALKGVGQIADYRFECVKLRLADRTFYTPDFMVLRADGVFEMHEVKGFWEDDARVKIKVAAELYPFKFIAARKQKGAWVFEEF